MNVNINGSWVTQASYQRARSLVKEREEGGRNSGNNVLASLRQAMPGWNISTNMQPFSGTGIQNIAIHPSMLRKAANDPDEMVRLKALVMDSEKANSSLGAWARQSGSQVISNGFIIDADGNTKSWGKSISRTGPERRSILDLPQNNRPSWAELMRKHLDSLLEANLKRTR